MSDVNANNKVKISRATVITIFIVIGLLLAGSIFIGLYVYFFNQNHNSAIIFEKAFEQIKDFDTQNIYTKQEMEGEIIGLLDNVSENYPMTVSAKRALYYKAYVFFGVGKYPESLELFQEFVKKYPKDYLAEKSYYFISYCFEYDNKIDDAIKIMDIMESKFKKSYYLSLVNFRLGFLYEKKKDVKKAIEYYQKLADDNDDTSQKEEAKKRLAILNNNIKL